MKNYSKRGIRFFLTHRKWYCVCSPPSKITEKFSKNNDFFKKSSKALLIHVLKGVYIAHRENSKICMHCRCRIIQSMQVDVAHFDGNNRSSFWKN